jgi:membrane-bound serine protease (ClpP class)
MECRETASVARRLSFRIPHSELLMGPLIWASLLLLLAIALVMLEVFVPSGGIISVMAALSVLGAVVLAFEHSGRAGFTFLAVALVAMPCALALALKVYPSTPLGRAMIPYIPTSEEVLPDNEHRRSLQDLVGKFGRAKSLMLPSGAAEIGGRTVDALSDGVAIEAGQLVRVVEVRGNRVLVRPASSEEAQKEGSVSTVAADDVLSRPIDSIGLDPFEDPIA